MIFRKDINGLRAVAVLAVVLFHFNPQWLSGGFAGVDVFFVISGFLMTSIIFNEIEKNTFNLFKFYTARANRIIPVLAVMGAVLLVFGWFYLLPTDYKDLGRQVEKSLLFTSNILFTQGDGYFDTNEKSKWLLHTWSLSVEWQFYIFFPIILLMLRKTFSHQKTKFIILILCLISFFYAVHLTEKNSQDSYFLLTTRAWEMLLGGLAFLYPMSIKNMKYRFFIQSVGVISVIASYFIFSEQTPWPSQWTLLPVVGTYLIILSGYQNNILLNNFISNAIGKWSYSIYVWHWPLVVASLYFSWTQWAIYGVLFSIILGFLSYTFVEQIKFKKYTAWKEIYKVKPLYMVLVLFFCSYGIKKTEGVELHYSAHILKILDEVNNTNPYKCDPGFHDPRIIPCHIGQANPIQAIVLGDSHANAVATSVAAVFDLKKEGVLTMTKSGCPYILGAKFSNKNCEAINLERSTMLEKQKGVPIFLVNRYVLQLEGENDPQKIDTKNPPKIYFNQKNEPREETYQGFEQNLHSSICTLTKTNPVYMVLQIPEMGFDVPKTIAKQALFSSKLQDPSITFKAYQARTEKVNAILDRVAAKCGAHILNPAAILCETGKCIAEYQGQPIYRDGDHLSEYGNKLLTPMFKAALSE
ncbi:acyltransferase family protein [Acinetobacter haemolyticus]|uniref:acyltransferase family protein n=1 Tax=Acinetobacter haemolyticus TaxID=29430 RepID=UPI000D6991A3|nr:acyltransferase family protein [Acinetobacter haemolyticus]